jgi:hypothetical protein
MFQRFSHQIERAGYNRKSIGRARQSLFEADSLRHVGVWICARTSLGYGADGCRAVAIHRHNQNVIGQRRQLTTNPVAVFIGEGPYNQGYIPPGKMFLQSVFESPRARNIMSSIKQNLLA